MKYLKQYINKASILSVSICLAMFASCSDYLDVSPTDQPESKDMYKTPKQAEQGIIGVYSDLRDLSNDVYLHMSECRSDNAWVLPETDGFRDYSEIGTFRATYELKTFDNAWNSLYKIIYDANVALAKIPDITFTKEDLKNQLIGEAHFLRGWAYFELVRLYGNVPIIDRPMTTAEVNKVGQSPAQNVYDKIIVPDLKAAEEMLPVTANMKTSNNTSAAGQGRADKIATQAMLGRVYMTMAGFPLKNSSAQDLAEVKLKEVIDFARQNNKYWAPDSTEWKKQWLSENNNKYSIFAIQYRSGGTGNPAIFNFTPILPPTYTTIRIFGNSIYLEKSLMYEFSKMQSNGKQDARGIGTTVLNGYDAERNYPAYPNTTEKVNIEGVGNVEVYSKSMIYKYTNTLRKRVELGYTANIEPSMKDAYDWPVNYPVIRLEDVMLMYAEILVNKHSNISEAINIVNSIRARAGCDAVKAATTGEALKAIKKERQLEFCGEGIRWFDMVRWGDWKKNVVDKFNRYNNPAGTKVDDVKDGRYLYPIPKSAMITTPGLYKQNTDY